LDAAKVLEIAVAVGDPDAEIKLGSLYSAGLGVKRDLEHARALFQLAVKKAYPPAMINLGRLDIAT
jgi:TPR repeat protein